VLQLRFPRGRPQVLEELRNRLVELWKKAHRLNEELSRVDLREAGRANANSAVTDLRRQTEHLNQLSTELDRALSKMKTALHGYVEPILRSPGKSMAEVYAKHLALTVLKQKDRETLEKAYWEARDGDKTTEPSQQTSRSPITRSELLSEAMTRSELLSEAMILTRNRGLIALEVLGDRELSRDCNAPETTTGPENQPVPSADKSLWMKELLRSLAEDQGKPDTSHERRDDLQRFGREIADRLDCLVQRFDTQGRPLKRATQTSPATPAGRSVRLADDELIRRIGPVSIFNANFKLLTEDPVPAHRLALFLESQARRASEDRWYGEESRERVGQGSPPYHERVARAFQADVKGLNLAVDGETTTTSRAGDLRLIGPDPLTLTSEPKIDVSYQLEADDDPVLRHGVAVAWIDQDSFRRPEDRSGEPVPRLAMSLAGGKSKDLTHAVAAPARGAWEPPRPRLAPRQERLGAKALFRGRVLEKTTDIQV
ncbi:MAG: hypothetical protein ABSE84_27545, partial [Isosphaeraceae bacterium]